MSRLKREELPPTPVKAANCAVCGAECIDMRINNEALCDSHFDGWLEFPRNSAVGGSVAMAEYIADEKAKARRSA